MHKLFPPQDLPASTGSVPLEQLEQLAKPAPNVAAPPGTPPPEQPSKPVPNATITLDTPSPQQPSKPAPNVAAPPGTPPQDLPASTGSVPLEQLKQLAKPAPNAAAPLDTPPPMTDTPPPTDAATAPASLTCNHYNCATVLKITRHRGLEDFTPGGDNGPGTYFATDVPEGDAVGQPQDSGIVDEKESMLWEITVRMQDGTEQTMQQDSAPGVQVGDSVLIEGNTIQPWN